MSSVHTVFHIPRVEVHFSFARSSGPGGQNVNKVNSKVILHWNLVASPSLPPVLRARLMSRLKNQITLAGDIVLSSDRFRDQGRNKQDCLEKLDQLIAAAAIPPKIRKNTRPSYSSQKRAKEAKTRHSQKKALRRDFK